MLACAFPVFVAGEFVSIFVADWTSGQFSAVDVVSDYEIPPSHLLHTMRPQSSTDLPLASITVFSSFVCRGKRLARICVCVCECVHMLVPISPSSLLSPSPHIQMSLHLSCKCLPVCVICESNCGFFACIRVRAHLVFVLCVCLHVRLCFSTGCESTCVPAGHEAGRPHHRALSGAGAGAQRASAYRLGVDKRPRFKER